MTKQELMSQLTAFTKLGTKRRELMSNGYATSLYRQVSSFIDTLPDDQPIPEGDDLAIRIRTWLAHKQDARASTKNTMAGNVSRFFAEHFMLKREHIDVVVRRFPRPAAKWSSQALTAPQLEALFRAFKPNSKSKYSGFRNYCLLATALLTGARRSQLMNITEWKHEQTIFNLWLPRLKNESQEATLKRIPHSIVLPSGDTYVYALSHYFGQRPQSKYLFCASNGNKLSDAYMYQMLGAFTQFKVHPHQLRHTAGTLVSERAGIMQAAILLDHEHVSTTQGYVTKSHVDTGAILETTWK